MRTSTTFNTGTRTGIGGTGAKLLTTETPYRCEVGIQFFAPNNSGVVWVGNNPYITVNSGLASDGFPIYSGDSILLPIRNPNQIYVKSNVGGLSINWILF